MDQVEKLSDKELLARFTEFGYKIGPVTKTTRKVLERKLVSLILEAEKTVKTTPRRIRRLSSLSSEEGRDPEINIPYSGTRNLLKKNITTRPRPNRSRQVFEKKKQAGVSTVTTTIANIDSLNTVRCTVPSDFDSEPSNRPDTFKGGLEDSDTVETCDLGRRCYRSISGMQCNEVPTSKLSASGYSYRQTETSELATSGIRNGYVPQSQLNTSAADSFVYNSHAALNRLLRPFESVFNVFKRCPSARSTRHSENNGFIPVPSTSYAADGNTYFQTANDRDWFSRNYLFVSKILVLLMLIFFALLAVSYATIRQGSPMDIRDTHLPICEDNATSLQNPTANCIPINRIRHVTKLMKIVYYILYELSCDTSCSSLYGNTQNDSLLTDYELVKDLKTKYPEYKSADLFKDIRYLKILIVSNPHWKIVLKNNINCELNTTQDEWAKCSGFTFKEVKVPVTCYVWYSCCMIVKIVKYSLFWFIFAIFVCKSLALYKRYVQNHKERVNTMVNHIITFVRSRYNIHVLAGTTHQFAMPIDYVRDQLIPEAERECSVVIWTSAVNYINLNESRLKQDVIVINGENRAVWLWNPEQDDYDSSPHS